MELKPKSVVGLASERCELPVVEALAAAPFIELALGVGRRSLGLLPMRNTVFAIISLMLACGTQSSDEGPQPAVPSAPSATPSARASIAGDDSKDHAGGIGYCCKGEECDADGYSNKAEWRSACERRGQTAGTWCPAVCAWSRDPFECECP
jgi:hypothetical protein